MCGDMNRTEQAAFSVSIVREYILFIVGVEKPCATSDVFQVEKNTWGNQEYRKLGRE